MLQGEMPRWLAILLTLLLFAAMMLALRAVLVAVLPGFNGLMDGALGKDTWTAIVIGLAIVGGVYGFWPRDRMGQMRGLPRRR